MHQLKYSHRFKKDLKRYQRDSVFLDILKEVLDILIQGEKLPAKNLNHSLTGEFRGCFECHIKPDVLLVYKVDEEEIMILLLRLGSHSELF